MGSSKLTADFVTGLDNRRIVEKHVNRTAMLAGSPIRIEPIHPEFRLMAAAEKARYNTQRNRETNRDPEKTMGLDYRIRSIYDHEIMEGEDRIVLHIRFSTDPGYYIKIPSDRRMDSDAYLEEIADHTFILFVLKEGPTIHKLYSGITPLRKMLKLPHELSTASGNEGRMVFQYSLSKISYMPLTQQHGFFNGSTLRQMEDVLLSFA